MWTECMLISWGADLMNILFKNLVITFSAYFTVMYKWNLFTENIRKTIYLLYLIRKIFLLDDKAKYVYISWSCNLPYRNEYMSILTACFMNVYDEQWYSVLLMRLPRDADVCHYGYLNMIPRKVHKFLTIYISQYTV